MEFGGRREGRSLTTMYDVKRKGAASITDFLGSSSNGKRKRQRLGGSKLQKGFERPEGFF